MKVIIQENPFLGGILLVLFIGGLCSTMDPRKIHHKIELNKLT